MSFEQNLKITYKLTINMAFDRKVWSGVRGRCNDADRGGQLKHHQDLPGVKGGHTLPHPLFTFSIILSIIPVTVFPI